VPFFLWDPGAFINTVVLLQTREPFRMDSLSYVSLAARLGWGQATFVWALGGAAVGGVFAWRKTPADAFGFAAAVAVTSLALFAFGSKAFCNYYFFVIGALSCAAAAAAARPDEVSQGTVGA